MPTVGVGVDDHKIFKRITDGHPFWVVTDEPDLSRAARSVVDENGVLLYHENIAPGLGGYWVEAKDLRVGDVFLGANGELSMLINAVRVEQDGGIAVFNFTVDGNHNYFILAKEYDLGQTCVLVHNGSCLRKNMIEANGGQKPPPGMEAHHDLAQKFRNEFAKRGIDIDKARYGRWVLGNKAGGQHQSWSEKFNKQWEKFFDKFPNATPTQILRQMLSLRRGGLFQ